MTLLGRNDSICQKKKQTADETDNAEPADNVLAMRECYWTIELAKLVVDASRKLTIRVHQRRQWAW
jgi:hypothetical protein